MASYLGACLRATPRAAHFSFHKNKYPIVFTTNSRVQISHRVRGNLWVKVLSGGDSYLDSWKRAVDRERKEIEFQKIAENLAEIGSDDGDDDDDNEEQLEKKSEEFKKILEVPEEERDRVQRMQVVDRAAAAIAAARAILEESSSLVKEDLGVGNFKSENDGAMGVQQGGSQSKSIFVPQSETSGNGTPGPDFWSWAPPQVSERSSDDVSDLQNATTSSAYPNSINPVVEKDQAVDFLSIPFESKLYEMNYTPPLPPFQSMMESGKVEVSNSSLDMSSLKEEHELGDLFSAHAVEAARALGKVGELPSHGVNPDGSRWWKETGIERRPDGVICRWTMTRGVSADQVVEWQEKFWEAANEFDYKELGSEKSGRDATGNVWREYWRESMWQERGLVHLEKTADKWGKNGKGDEWQEKWWEHYNASGQAEKWAHKWCSIDPSTQLEAGHAHVWHERWGETYDGHGGSIKYTDKWAERSEGDGWTKWGDKWDENFDLNGHGVKQGEKWWEGKHRERWNRTWGEHHNGSGWVHKYGKSSCGEHWDTHVEQDTWYERFPHYGFYHCFDNSVQLREVQKPSEKQ